MKEILGGVANRKSSSTGIGLLNMKRVAAQVKKGMLG